MTRVLVVAVLASVAVATWASAQQPGGGTAPSYPGNSIVLRETGPIVAGYSTRLHMSGRADWGAPTDETTIPYSLAIYAQNADVDTRCEPSYGAQLQKSINLPNLGASETLTDFVLNGELQINPSPPAPSIDWSGESLPFVITPGVSRVLLCGYMRYVIDDVAWFQLPVEVRRYPCTLSTRTVRKARGLRVSCPGFQGPVRARFERNGKRRTIAASIRGGTALVRTRRLVPGVYRVIVLARGVPVSARARVRIR
jgi:hypothetical protein